MRYSINLESAGNPDFRQYGPISPQQTTFANTFNQASQVCRNYIKHFNLGGGNWIGGQICEGTDEIENGVYKEKQVAQVSYNGRVWGMADKEIK